MESEECFNTNINATFSWGPLCFVQSMYILLLPWPLLTKHAVIPSNSPPVVYLFCHQGTMGIMPEQQSDILSNYIQHPVISLNSPLCPCWIFNIYQIQCSLMQWEWCIHCFHTMNKTNWKLTKVANVHHSTCIRYMWFEMLYCYCPCKRQYI